MMTALQDTQINWTTSVGTTQISAEIRQPYQHTPRDVYLYLKRMDFAHTTSKSGDLWMHKGEYGNEYMTWEQAVVYCLVKPWLVEEA
jgi:hypothetical protein